ncbi:MAG: ferredoxin--NADP reductase [Salinibacter sp.]
MTLLNATVAAITSVTPRVRQLLLRVDGHTFDHDPGQHVSVRYEKNGEGPIYRPYSPVSGPGTDTLALAVKRYDDGTCSVWLHELDVGDEVPILPPSGTLHLQSLDRDAAFIATGTGLTPMLAMLDPYLREGTGQARLLFGERTQADLMYRPMLDRLAATHPRFEVHYTLSGEDWGGPTGYVQDHLSLLDDLEAPQAYLCGVPEMVVETRSALRAAGVSSDHIFSEGWEDGAVAD